LDGQLLTFKEENAKYTHAEHITLFIQDVMKQASKNAGELDAIAVSMGPGSYTGLRIGVSTAKGLCYALDKPLIAIPTLKSMAYGFLDKKQETQNSRLSLFCPMIDARRMEVFCAIYDAELNEIKKTSAEIITENSFSDLLKDHTLLFFGDGAVKCKEALSHQPNAVFIDDVFPSSKYMVEMADKKFKEKQFENVALFEPFYLKDFFTGEKAG
jgi:tRNA threonylcarbamoyladenosine biosynthesis protein TsaB